MLVGRDLVDVYFAFPRFRRSGEELKGRVVTSVDTCGKAMLTRFDNGLTLYSHNQLYGVWHTALRDHLPRTTRALRVALHTATHSALLYSATDIQLLTSKQLAKHPFLSRVGPDILDEEIMAADVSARLMDSCFEKRALGSLYLDQAFLAGVGNYLRSEILHAARVHHNDRPVELDCVARKGLARATLKLSRRSYRTRGITITQNLARSLRSQGLPYQQYRFWVYGREGLPCHTCGGPIKKTAVSSRGLFYCPRCQVRALDPGLKPG